MVNVDDETFRVGHDEDGATVGRREDAFDLDFDDVVLHRGAILTRLSGKAMHEELEQADRRSDDRRVQALGMADGGLRAVARADDLARTCGRPVPSRPTTRLR